MSSFPKAADFNMAAPTSSVLRAILKGALVLAGIIVLLSMYYRSFPSPRCHPSPKQLTKQDNSQNESVATTPSSSLPGEQQADKPVVLLWFWPESKKFDFQVCKKLNINNCRLTDDRSLYSSAHAVLIFHKAIKDDLSNLPTTPRPAFQRWIWLNMDPPSNTLKIAGIESLFNLTASFREDADIHVRWQLTAKKHMDDNFVLPEKEHLLCWIVNSSDLDTQTGEEYRYYKELIKYIKVDIFDSSSNESSRGENYFRTISSCKFFLSFENSDHKDHITETFNGPLAAGTVPIVLGPLRKNYERFVPSTSFIHVNDFPDPLALAEFLLKLDDDNEAYMKYFDWRHFYNVRRHFTEENHAFALAICQACRHIGITHEFRVVRDLYKWFFI
ncbi:putative alpha-(1-3)-fucosyltransferase 9-like [Scophthalmus maximus]|uniref:Fucosyltransferase n=1 Tax=Scophthalmus maximus TaxID=52904 RepID=A0A2U9D080_SCOMX|nr:putative alpha-(1-3)-fucosyltransferase 9-like [Scophthalmus maximus]